VIGVAFLFSIPLFASDYWVTWLTLLAITIVAVMGLHILTGLCGIFSIGQAAFMGVGAYTVAILTSRYGLSGWVCLPLSALSAGLVGLFFGIPCFRLKGFYIAVTTLAASFIIIWCIQYFREWTGGSAGLAVTPLKLGSIDLRSRAGYYCLTMAVMILATFFAKNIQRTSVGRAFVAIKVNELAAEVSGISLYRYKMLAFFIGCLYAGLAGWLWTYFQWWVTPEQFNIYKSIWYFGMLAVGGMGSTSGVLFGAVFIRLLEVLIDHITPLVSIAEFNVSMSLVLFAIVVLAFLIFEPRGLSYRWEKFKTYYRLRPYSYRG
jgi:branched-chain amino acid transport system permease protein